MDIENLKELVEIASKEEGGEIWTMAVEEKSSGDLIHFNFTNVAPTEKDIKEYAEWLQTDEEFQNSPKEGELDIVVYAPEASKVLIDHILENSE